jgi:hypothetical protein
MVEKRLRGRMTKRIPVSGNFVNEKCVHDDVALPAFSLANVAECGSKLGQAAWVAGDRIAASSVSPARRNVADSRARARGIDRSARLLSQPAKPE